MYKKISIYLFFLIILASFSLSQSVPNNCIEGYELEPGDDVIIIAHGEGRIIYNEGEEKLFIPCKYDYEWEAVRFSNTNDVKACLHCSLKNDLGKSNLGANCGVLSLSIDGNTCGSTNCGDYFCGSNEVCSRVVEPTNQVACLRGELNECNLYGDGGKCTTDTGCLPVVDMHGIENHRGRQYCFSLNGLPLGSNPNCGSLTTTNPTNLYRVYNENSICKTGSFNGLIFDCSFAQFGEGEGTYNVLFDHGIYYPITLSGVETNKRHHTMFYTSSNTFEDTPCQ